MGSGDSVSRPGSVAAICWEVRGNHSSSKNLVEWGPSTEQNPIMNTPQRPNRWYGSQHRAARFGMVRCSGLRCSFSVVLSLLALVFHTAADSAVPDLSQYPAR